MGCHALLQGIFPTQGSNLDLQHCLYIFKDGHSNQYGRYLTTLLICISLIISGGQGEFLDSQHHAMVTGVISTWLILGEECALLVEVSRSVVSDSFPPRGL